MDRTIPNIVINNTQGSLIIHDLRTAVTEPGLHLTPPVAGETPRLYYLLDMFGERAIRASSGLRDAVNKGLVKIVTEEEAGKLKPLPQTLADKLEVAIGKVASRRKPDEKAGGLVYNDPVLTAEVTNHISKENVYDTALREKRAELKNDIVN